VQLFRIRSKTNHILHQSDYNDVFTCNHVFTCKYMTYVMTCLPVYIWRIYLYEKPLSWWRQQEGWLMTLQWRHNGSVTLVSWRHWHLQSVRRVWWRPDTATNSDTACNEDCIGSTGDMSTKIHSTFSRSFAQNVTVCHQNKLICICCFVRSCENNGLEWVPHTKMFADTTSLWTREKSLIEIQEAHGSAPLLFWLSLKSRPTMDAQTQLFHTGFPTPLLTISALDVLSFGLFFAWTM